MAEKILTNERGFERDMYSMALLNNRKDDFEAYKKRRADQMSADKEIADLKSEISDIKNMLMKLMDNNNG